MEGQAIPLDELPVRANASARARVRHLIKSCIKRTRGTGVSCVLKIYRGETGRYILYAGGKDANSFNASSALDASSKLNEVLALMEEAGEQITAQQNGA